MSRKLKCPKCGGPARCFYIGDSGGYDYYDDFCLKCGDKRCGHEEGGTVFSTGYSGGLGVLCPFCDKGLEGHDPPS